MLNGTRHTISISTVTLLLVSFAVLLHDRGAGQEHYRDVIAPAYGVQKDIVYGESVTHNGSLQKLTLDLYRGNGDTAGPCALVLFIHGGGFRNGDKVSKFGQRVCGSLAKRGYLVASINYRTNPEISSDPEHFEAMLKAVQDAKAAVRFFRRHASRYHVDTTQIYVTGSSAGSITALHMAYLDSAEVPSFVDMKSLGSLEGNSGNPGYSSHVDGVIANWGAMGDYRWISPGDVPVYCVHGDADTVVPFDSSFSDGPFKYGSRVIADAARELGVPSGLRRFARTGHTLDNDPAKQDSAISAISSWLAGIVRMRSAAAQSHGNGIFPQGGAPSGQAADPVADPVNPVPVNQKRDTTHFLYRHP